MTIQTNKKIMIGAALVALAGLPAAAIGQAGSIPSRTDQNQRDDARAMDAQRFELASADKLMGAKIANPGGEDVGSVEDLIAERSTGAVLYAVVKSGAILGLGGKSVAVPFSSFNWDAANNRFSLNMTPEQVKALPEFTADSWANLHRTDSGLRTWLNRQFDESDRTTRGSEPINAANPTTIRGTVTSVERSSYGPHGEDVVMVVRTDEGREERVLLGPSWYVMGANGAPMRDKKVTLQAVRHDGPVGLVAVNADFDGARTTYRDAQGRPSWTGDTTESRQWRERGPGARLVRLSDVKGADVQCRGESCGKVADVIVDHRSGRALMLSIDPDQNILGIGDTDRLVPWSIAYLGADGVINIDANKEMITSSVQTPKDWTTLRDANSVRRVYEPFRVGLPGSGAYGTDPTRPQPNDPMRDPNRSNNADPNNRNQNPPAQPERRPN